MIRPVTHRAGSVLRAQHTRFRGRLRPSRGKPLPRGGSPRPRSTWIGLDAARVRQHPLLARSPWLPAALIGLLFGTLALTALRGEIIEVRYEIMSSNEQVAALSEKRAQLVTLVEELRDPRGLATRARQLGLQRPVRTIDLRTIDLRNADRSPIEIADAGTSAAARFSVREGRSH